MKNKICVIVLAICFCAATKANAQARIKRFCEISFNPVDRYFQIDYGKTSKTDPFKDAAFIKSSKG